MIKTLFGNFRSARDSRAHGVFGAASRSARDSRAHAGRGVLVGHEHYGLTALAFVLASFFSLPLLAMPTREETAQAMPVVKQLLASERAALVAGKKTRAEVADAALKLAQEADTEAAKLLLMKGAFVLYVKDGQVEKAAQTMSAIEKTIADLPPQTVTNMIDLALLGLPNKKDVRDQLYQKMHPNGRVASMRRPPAVAAKETKYLQATVDDYTWSYHINNGEATIEAEKDGMFVCAVSPNPTGDIAIPSMLNGVKVTSIGQEAFCHYKGPKSVKIPEGVKSIGWCAFYRCNNLVSVTLPSSLKNIGHGAFSECGGLTDITIPAGVTDIDAYAFLACAKLKSITIPSGVKSIKEHAFDLCCGLTSITIPDGVESIDRQAFYNCRGLKAVNIPAKVKSMGMAAFARCADLASVAMLGEKPNAPDDIFNDCPKLKEIHVPASAKSWAGMKEWQGRKLVFDAKVSLNGHTSFCFTENRGRLEIVGAGGQRFVTKWSGCGADAVYAYKDYVALVGVSDTMRDFPTSSADFVSLDWEQRAPTIKKGAFVVFLNAANEFLCVRVDDVKSKSHGEKEDKLSLTYRAYEADVASSKSIQEAHRIAQTAYSITGKDQGTGEFRYAANGGRLLIEGSRGQRFDTKWSSCSADSVYAYSDYVGAVSACQNWTSFPATAEEFQSLDWSKRSVTVTEGACVAFRNKSNQYLCVRIPDVKSKSRGDNDDLIRFEFKIYSTSDMAGGKKTPRLHFGKERTSIQSIIDGMIKVSGKDFWLSETELTQGQWEAVMGNNPSRHKGANLPVECVSRDDCDVFLAKLNQTKEVQASRFEFYLPTLPEWMYAAQAGGSGTDCCVKPGVVGAVLDMAWVKENSGGETHAVATKTPNAFGFYDMLGNVWEWMFGEDQTIGCRHGFAFDDAAAECSVKKGWHKPRNLRFDYCGLRVAARVRPVGDSETCADAF